MNRPRLLCLGILSGLLTAGSFASHASAQAAPATTPPTRVAVVNLQHVYKTIQESQDTYHQLVGLQDQLNTKHQSDQLALKTMQDDMNQKYKAGSDAREQAMAKFDQESVQFDSDEQLMKINIARTQAHQMVQAYSEIKAVVAQVAKEKGLDLVIVSNPDLPDNAMDVGNLEQLQNLVFTRSVLYSSDKTDISEEVITRLDAAYKAGKAAPAPGH